MDKSKYITVVTVLILCFTCFKISTMEKGAAGNPPQYNQPQTPSSEKTTEIIGYIDAGGKGISPDRSKVIAKDIHDQNIVHIYDLNDGKLLHTHKNNNRIRQVSWIDNYKVLIITFDEKIGAGTGWGKPEQQQVLQRNTIWEIY